MAKKKFLTFTKKAKFDEYNVRGKGGIIGCLAKGYIFKKRMVLHTEPERTEWTSECLRQAADYLEYLESQCGLP